MDGISIIVCTYNGEKRIIDVLQHIVDLQSECAWELVVVNNASTDRTVTICEQFLAKKGSLIDWKIINELQAGLNFARKRGLEESKYTYVLFCDDDNLLRYDYLKEGYKILSNNSRIGVLGGCGIPVTTGKFPQWFSRFAHSYAVGPQAEKTEKLTDFPAEVYGAGAFFRKQQLQVYFKNGFETIMTDRKGSSLVSGGDVELCYMMQLSGFDIWFHSELLFKHIIPANRLTWMYYLELKKGIAKGVANLIVYRVMFKKKNPSVIYFISYYYSAFFHTLLIYVNFKVKKSIFIKKYSKEDKELAEAILPVKLKDLVIGFPPALKHFIFLGKFMGKHILTK